MPRTCINLAILAILVVETLSHAAYVAPSPGPGESSDALTVTNLIDRSSHHYHAHADPTFKSIWKKKIVWKPRWVKTWQEKKVYVAVWKRMWGPAVINEWVPLAKPPPGWSTSHSHEHHIHDHTPEIKHTSYGVPIHRDQYH